MFRATILALLLLSVTTLSAHGAETGAAAQLSTQVDAVFAAYDSTVTPGCALAVIQNGEVAYKRGYGMADLDHDVPITPASPFHVASVSKQFTAAAILLLAADGKLALDDEVRKYVPEVPDFGKPITLRQLVHHTGGLRDQWDLLDLAGWRYSLDLITDEDVLSVVSRQKGLNFPPGERHLYCNTGYTLLAQVVKRVSGQSFREFTDARIFRPLGMASTHFRDDHAEIVKHQAIGYEPAEGGSSTYRLSVTNFDTVGATSLLTTAEDLARWDRNFYDPRVGGEGLLRQMLETGTLNSGKKLEYAGGLVVGEYRGLKTVEHGGADAGYRANLLRFPEQRFSVAILCNLASANPTELSRKVADLYLAKDLRPAGPADGDAAGAEPAAVPLAPERLASFAGLYWSAEDETSLRVVLEDGKLFAAPSPSQRFEMRPASETSFRLVGAPVELRAETRAEGRPSFALVTAEGETRRTYAPVQEVKPTATELAAFAGNYRSAEIDPVYRIDLEEGRLVLKRLKAKPDVLEPLFDGTFRGSVGVLRFQRSAKGKPTGFTLGTGRIRNMVFEKGGA